MGIEARHDLVLIDGHFQDFSQFKEAVVHWDLDFTLLKKRFDSKLFYALINDTIFGKVRFNCSIEQSGNCPIGMRTFVVPVESKVNYTWRGFDIDADTLQLFPKNGELYSISNASFHNYVISFPEQDFLNALIEQGLDPDDGSWSEAIVWKLNAASLQPIRRLCRYYEHGWKDEDKMLLHLLVSSLSAHKRIERESTQNRQRVEKGVEFLRKTNFDISRLEELVDHCQCSERSLQYAFKSLMGVSPMNYVKRSRLKQVFNELVTLPNKPISDIANQYGFWHMGQFARDFKKVYGKLPSDLR